MEPAPAPPPPPWSQLAMPVLSNHLWLHSSVSDFDVLRELDPQYGPIITLRIGPRPLVIVADRVIACKALVELGDAFSDRPAPLPAARFFTANQQSISSAGYGPLWHLLRGNLTSGILHPARVKLFAGGRKWALGMLMRRLRSQADDHGVAVAMESFRFAMFCLLVLMCFGEKLEAVKETEAVQRDLLLNGVNLKVLGFLPSIRKHLFRHRLKNSSAMVNPQKQLYVPLIEAQKLCKNRLQNPDPLMVDDRETTSVYSYVDSLLEIELPEQGGRKLSEDELVALCSEFLNAGTGSTSTALQWIMANLVKHQGIQGKPWEEIERVAAARDDAEGAGIKEEDLQSMTYLKAVVMEGLRRHPPGHLLLPHRATEDVDLCRYRIHKGRPCTSPWRRLTGTGSSEIKMMPFGAGRRMCQGRELAMLHVEYIAADLVREFEWKAGEGEEADTAEKEEFTAVMKNPVRARIIPRKKST